MTSSAPPPSDPPRRPVSLEKKPKGAPAALPFSMTGASVATPQAKKNPTLTPSGQGKVDPLVLVMARNSFYNANAQNLLKVAIAQFVMIVIMVSVLVRIFIFTASRDYYFPIQTNNSLILERPLYEPLMSDEDILIWTEDALRATFTFGSYDYLTRLQDARAYYTTKGWATFTKALTDSNILALINAKPSPTVVGTDQVVTFSIHPGTAPQITKRGVLDGRYVWEVHAEIDVTLQDSKQQSRFSWESISLIERQPTMSSRFGIGISSMVVRKPKQ